MTAEQRLKCCGCPSVWDKQCEDCDCHINAWYESRHEDRGSSYDQFD